MTGLPTLTVELEDAAGNFTHNIRDYVHMPTGWSLSRGRNDEQSDITSGQLSLRLDNVDGRFTLGSPAYDGIFTDKRIRLTETVGGVVSRRHVGYVQDWPVQWESPAANYAVCAVTSIDRQARLARHSHLSVTRQEILLDAPFAYFPLDEPAVSTSAGDVSGRGSPSLATSGAGAALSFGAAELNAWDGVTVCAFAGGQYLSGNTFGSPAYIEVVASRSGNPAAAEFIVWSTHGPSLVMETDGKVSVYEAPDPTGASPSAGTLIAQTPTSMADGALHHYAIGQSVFVWTLYVDGESVATGTGGIVPTVLHGSLWIGTGFTGNIGQVGLWGVPISAARVRAHADAILNGFATETADQRIARIAAYSHIAPADLDLEPGQQPSIAPCPPGGYSLDAMKAVAQAEGGVVFIAGDGRLTLHNKAHRPLSAAAAPILALTAQDVDPGDLTFSADKTYLVNTASGSRSGGATQQSVNDASVLVFEEYRVDRSNALLPTDALMLDQLQWTTNIYGTTAPRISTVTLDLLTLDAALVESALTLEIGDRITLSGLPTQAPMATADLLVEGLKESQSATTWRLTLNTVPASLFHAPIVDTPSAIVDTGYPVYF